MNILMITENDPAGMGIAFTNAINTYTEHSCRLVSTAIKYNFDFEKDLHVPDFTGPEWEEVDQLLKKADIIHFHILADEHLHLGPLKIADFLAGKRILHHHHGHPDFRSNPRRYAYKYKRMNRKAIVSTPDLLQLMPEATWQPNLVPVNAPLYLPNPTRFMDGEINIGHSPTRKALKNTDLLLAVLDTLNNGYKRNYFKLDLIEHCRHRECMARKRNCHVVFDHMQGYFGVSSLESLSQGKTVIAGLDSWNIKNIQEFTNSETIPWVICKREEDLRRTLVQLFEDKSLLLLRGEESRYFMCNKWSDKQVAERLINFYDLL